MNAVSRLGDTPVVAAIIIFITFSLNLRSGLSVLLAVFISGAAVMTLKAVFEYPRPVYLDLKVGEPGDDSPPPTLFDKGGSEQFWGLPKQEAINRVRQYHKVEDEGADGFPSGHVSTATTLSLGIALIFMPRFGVPLALGWTLLMALSRMYLGRHFLADVIGGFALGLVCFGLAYWISRTFRAKKDQQAKWWTGIFLLIITACAVSIPYADLERFGDLAGLLIGMFVFLFVGFPMNEGSYFKRFCRFVLAMVVYVVASIAIKSSSLDDIAFGEFFGGTLIIFVTLLVSVVLGIKLGLFQENRKVA